MEMMKGPFGEGVYFKNKIPAALTKTANTYFFVDKYFKGHASFKNCKNICYLSAGEQLKTLGRLEKNLRWLSDNGANKSSTIVGVGGGSVGDSIGFLSSVYMRGVDFVSVPTTWLAAVDSAVGGKTALNFKGCKNQIGTVYGPKEILLIEELLDSSDLNDSEGEVLKNFVLNLDKSWARKALKKWPYEKDLDLNLLRRLIKYKISVVRRDLHDTKNERAVLNLGHSMGHVLESYFKLSHSVAVKYGLNFSVNWSKSKKLLSQENFQLIKFSLQERSLSLNLDKAEHILNRDKKAGAGKINFIFPTDTGPVVKKVKIQTVLKEYERQVRLGL